MNHLWVLILVFVTYVVESWLSCRRIGAFLAGNQWFYVWDCVLVVLPFFAMGGFLSSPTMTGKALVVVAAVLGNCLGVYLSKELKREVKM